LKGEIQRKKGIVAKQGVRRADVEKMGMTKFELTKRINCFKKEKQDIEKASWDFQKYAHAKRDSLFDKANKFDNDAKDLMRSMGIDGDISMNPFDPNFVKNVQSYIMPWLDQMKQKVLDKVDETENTINNHKIQITDLENQKVDLEQEYATFEKKIKQRETETQELQKKKTTEYYRLVDEYNTLEGEYEKVKREAEFEREKKENELAEATKELEETRIRYKSEKDEWDKQFLEAKTMVENHISNILEMEQGAVERIRGIKNEMEKRGKGGGGDM